MLDPVVLLTPLLAVGVLLLLGFAGCEFHPGAWSTNLHIEARVPTALNVKRIIYSCTPAGGMPSSETVTNPTPDHVDGTDNVFVHDCGRSDSGGCSASCDVSVAHSGVSAEATAMAMFVIDGTEGQDVYATFQASGTPAGGDFALAFVGAV